jgi:hypothetical protein
VLIGNNYSSVPRIGARAHPTWRRLLGFGRRVMRGAQIGQRGYA